ncbi:MAG: hypothetical protein GX778_02485 [Erysipelothrix sp.]|nr:hypothetical protein [Erysipelothrix sp.]
MTESNQDFENQKNPNSQYTQEDIEKNMTMAGLAYFLFLLPLIVCPESQYAKYHANQGLILLIVAFGGNVILGLIPIIGWMIIPIFSLAIFALAIIGLINGLTGKTKPLPLIGQFTIIK